MKVCPACQREVQDETKECQYCGVVFGKWKEPALKQSAVGKDKTVSAAKFKDSLWWAFSFLLGFASFVVLEAALHVPGKSFDLTVGRFLWVGPFLSGIALGFAKPERVWRWCIAIAAGAGAPIIWLLANLFSGDSSVYFIKNFFPASLAFIIANLVPAILGGYLGVFVRIKLVKQRNFFETKG